MIVGTKQVSGSRGAKYIYHNLTSMISWGVIILSAFIPVALLYAATLEMKYRLWAGTPRNTCGICEIIEGILAVTNTGYTGCAHCRQ